jgi:hypothetical protein
MTTEILEQIRTIAEYEGWVRREYHTVHGRELYENDRSAQWLDSMNYHKSYDWLMPVAKRAYHEIDGNLNVNPFDRDILLGAIESAFLQDISDLFAATFTAITFLNSLK